ncbi:MAG: VOC family protein [Cyclobacteriaceae bacterium]|nr:VOC family protein [Cyclobacteriaceae bacterium]
MQVHPYLNFDGQAEEAFNFYKSVFGGEITSIMKMKDAPDGDKLSPAEQNRVMHISMPIGKGTILMASDIMPSMGHAMQHGNQTYIMLTPESREEADHLFEGLSKDGEIEMPLEDQFWGDYYGSFKDKYGILWMIDYDPRQS